MFMLDIEVDEPYGARNWMYQIQVECKHGWYDPGVTYALPENCYPPEGESAEAVDVTVIAVSSEDDGEWQFVVPQPIEVYQKTHNWSPEEIKHFEKFLEKYVAENEPAYEPDYPED